MTGCGETRFQNSMACKTSSCCVPCYLAIGAVIFMALGRFVGF